MIDSTAESDKSPKLNFKFLTLMMNGIPDVEGRMFLGVIICTGVQGSFLRAHPLPFRPRTIPKFWWHKLFVNTIC